MDVPLLGENEGPEVDVFGDWAVDLPLQALCARGSTSPLARLYRGAVYAALLAQLWSQSYVTFASGWTAEEMVVMSGSQLQVYNVLMMALYMVDILCVPSCAVMMWWMPRCERAVRPLVARALPGAGARIRQSSRMITAWAAAIFVVCMAFAVNVLRRDGILASLKPGWRPLWDPEASEASILAFQLSIFTWLYVLVQQLFGITAIVLLFSMGARAHAHRLSSLSWRIARSAVATPEAAFAEYLGIRDDCRRLSRLWRAVLVALALYMTACQVIMLGLLCVAPDGSVNISVTGPSLAFEAMLMVGLAWHIAVLNSGGLRLVRTVLRSSAWTPEERQFLAHDIDCVPLDFDLYGFRLTTATAVKLLLTVAAFAIGAMLTLASRG